MGNELDLSIVIVNYNTKALLLDCLASIEKTVETLAMEIFVVDNASTDGSAAAVQQAYPQVKLIQNQKNLGFAAANNRAFEKMEGRYALLLNTDTVLTAGAAERLYAFMEENPGVAMACGQLLNADGSRQNSIANFPSLLTLMINESLLKRLFPAKFPGKQQQDSSPRPVDSCIGACLLVRRKAMDAVGWLDEDYFFFFEETDWALRMHCAGWKIYQVPEARIYHLQGQSVGHNIGSRILFFRSRYIYFKKWHRRYYRLVRVIIFVRLLANAALNLAATVMTLGMSRHAKNKLDVYARLIAWHLEGCPQER